MRARLAYFQGQTFELRFLVHFIKQVKNLRDLNVAGYHWKSFMFGRRKQRKILLFLRETF